MNRPLTPEELLLDGMPPLHEGMAIKDQKMLHAIARMVVDEVAPLLKRISELEATVAELQASSTKFCGVWQRAMEYRRGALVVHDNGLWIAIADTHVNAEPSQSKLWQLGHKSSMPRQPTASRT